MVVLPYRDEILALYPNFFRTLRRTRRYKTKFIIHFVYEDENLTSCCCLTPNLIESTKMFARLDMRLRQTT